MKDYKVKCSRPVEIGKLSKVGYMILSFDGHDRISQLPNLSDDEQFKVGYEAGKGIKKNSSICCS
ncbi:MULTISPECIES: hypothetical protein [Methanobacterium]|jgi:hypothetical protein|uniref:Uncharacterized protein n=1 Tax=Methanobacterium veterum TaxID=408577 RepID=A0A9E5DLN4_9EURY|nr:MULTISPECIES: hypothetical protein [Methanobacterium]MCZ3365578.1 hypothetical protein [Methanobacterium veterum]MCZ3371041.1 hypothetical protein [Methanobacterium veterum]